MNTREWYAEESAGGWDLNEHNPGASDGWLATFGPAQGQEARQAAHEHNCHAGLLAACREALRTLNKYGTEPVPVGVYNRVATMLSDAISSATEG